MAAPFLAAAGQALAAAGKAAAAAGKTAAAKGTQAAARAGAKGAQTAAKSAAKGAEAAGKATAQGAGNAGRAAGGVPRPGGTGPTPSATKTPGGQPTRRTLKAADQYTRQRSRPGSAQGSGQGEPESAVDRVVNSKAVQVAEKTNPTMKAVTRLQRIARQDGPGKTLMQAGAAGAFLSIMLVFTLVTALIGTIVGVLGGIGGILGGAGAAAAACVPQDGAPSQVALADIPPVAMKAYRQAGTASGVDWSFIAAIGKIESNHGRHGGRHLDAAGNVQPTPILGPQTRYGRAEGPMQFLSSTWASQGRDGDFDGKKNPQNIFDAALATGFYLKVSGAPGDMRKAVFAYNHSTAYVNQVLAQAKEYKAAGTSAPISGAVRVAQANIPTRAGTGGMRKVLGDIIAKSAPDFVTLNEVNSYKVRTIESAAPGYGASRSTGGFSDPMVGENVILWKTKAWKRADGGVIRIVENDKMTYQGKQVNWNRYATWATFERRSDGAFVSVIAVHHMMNPDKYGPKQARARKYGRGMDLIIDLAEDLTAQGPVFVGGDFNTVPKQQNQAWSAVAKMRSAGYSVHADWLDHLYYPEAATLTGKWKGPTTEPDHRWIAARFRMGGTGGPGGPGVHEHDHDHGGMGGIGGPGGAGIAAPMVPTQAQLAPVPLADKTAKGWSMPMKPGTYTFTARYGRPGSMWSKGYHTGLDFGAAVGTPVFAAGPGKLVHRTDQGWAGHWFVEIHHGKADGKDIVTWYGHMSGLAKGVRNGMSVKAGDHIGFVGAEGNVTGPHLHFEVHANGTDVDPMMFLTGAGVPDGSVATDECGPTGTSGVVAGNGAWGGYENGRIPLTAMCQLQFEKVYLECNAAKALDLLNAAYVRKFGTSIGPVGGYRSYGAQVQCRQEKGNLCATPGTSNHGWGLAADLAGGGINNFGSAQHLWMRANAGRYGWVLPEWAQQGGSKPEPWHWEYTGTGNATANKKS